ncbi:MAG: O-antigen ligase family protein [Caldilineaceae bacterium]
MLMRNTQQKWQTLLPAIVVLGGAIMLGALAVQQVVVALAAALVCLLAFFVITQPNIATLAVMFILYTNAAVVAVKFHHLPYVIGAAFIFLLFIPLIHYLVFLRQPLVITPVMKLLIVFLLVQILGTIFTTKGIDLAAPELMTFVVEGVLLYFLVTNAVRTPQNLRLVIWTLLLAGAFMGTLSLHQQITGNFDSNYGGFAQAPGEAFGTGDETLQGAVAQPRLAGPIGEKNRYAQIMLMLVPLGMFRFWGERSFWLRMLAALLSGLTLIGSILTFSRGGAVGFALMLMVMVVMRYIKWQQLLIVLVVAIMALQLFPQFGKRLSSLGSLSSIFSDESAGLEQTDGAIQGRATEMLAAALVFIDHPLIGVGPGMFRYYVQEYAKDLDIRAITTDREAHILYLGIAADHGLLGLGCFLAMLYITLRGLAETRKRWLVERPELANMAAAFMFSIIIYMTTGLFLHMSYMRYFWLMLALAGVAEQIAHTPAPAATTALAPATPTQRYPAFHL